MQRKNSLFILKKFSPSISATSSSTWAVRAVKNITPAAASFSYPVVDGVEYYPIAIVQYSRNWAGVGLTNFRLTTDATYFANVINAASSARTSNSTLSIDVLFAPAYLFEGENPMFKKVSYTYTTNESIPALGVKEITNLDFGCTSHPYDFEYVLFSFTQAYANTAAFAFTTIDYIPSSLEDIMAVVQNTSTSAKTLTDVTLEFVLVNYSMYNELASYEIEILDDSIGDAYITNKPSPLFVGDELSIWFDHADNVPLPSPAQSEDDIQCKVTVTSNATGISTVSYGDFPYTKSIIMPEQGVHISATVSGYRFQIMQYTAVNGAKLGTAVDTDYIAGDTVTRLLPGTSASTIITYGGFRYTYTFSGVRKIIGPSGFGWSYGTNKTSMQFVMPQNNIIMQYTYTYRATKI